MFDFVVVEMDNSLAIHLVEQCQLGMSLYVIYMNVQTKLLVCTSI